MGPASGGGIGLGHLDLEMKRKRILPMDVSESAVPAIEGSGLDGAGPETEKMGENPARVMREDLEVMGENPARVMREDLEVMGENPVRVMHKNLEVKGTNPVATEVRDRYPSAEDKDRDGTESVDPVESDGIEMDHVGLKMEMDTEDICAGDGKYSERVDPAGNGGEGSRYVEPDMEIERGAIPAGYGEDLEMKEKGNSTSDGRKLEGLKHMDPVKDDGLELERSKTSKGRTRIKGATSTHVNGDNNMPVKDLKERYYDIMEKRERVYGRAAAWKKTKARNIMMTIAKGGLKLCRKENPKQILEASHSLDMQSMEERFDVQSEGLDEVDVEEGTERDYDRNETMRRTVNKDLWDTGQSRRGELKACKDANWKS